MRWCIRIICGVVFVIALVLASAEWRFGSLRAARAYYRGQIVTVSVPQTQLIPGENGRFDFPLLVTNNSPHPVMILGANAACRCAQITGLPIHVPPLQAGEVKVSAAVGTAQIILYTDAAPVTTNVAVTPDGVTVVNP